MHNTQSTQLLFEMSKPGCRAVQMPACDVPKKPIESLLPKNAISETPLPLPGETRLADGTDPRYRRCADAWASMQLMTPLLAVMHPMNPDHIHEELELMTPDFASYNFEWLSMSPRWRDHYYAHDQAPHYEYMRNALRTLTHLRGPNRWVLKCPQHMEQLAVLKQVFPDATVVITHRAPIAVIQSSVTMIAYGARMRLSRIDTEGLMQYWSDRIEHMLRACVRDRAAWPASESLDVYFHEFMADEERQLAGFRRRHGLHPGRGYQRHVQRRRGRRRHECQREHPELDRPCRLWYLDAIHSGGNRQHDPMHRIACGRRKRGRHPRARAVAGHHRDHATDPGIGGGQRQDHRRPAADH